MNIYIDNSKGRGRGVFAARFLPEGTGIEEAPVIVLPTKDKEFLLKTTLKDYYYEWNDDLAIVLGYGSMYNHAYKPNADYFRNEDSTEMYYVAIKDINPGEEIFVNYNGDPEDQTPVWFDVI